MCFPTLYPTGEFGEFHYRTVKLSPSQFAKSRLLNKDGRFRKNPQYIFYLLWQKEMRELQMGIYNVIKCSKSQPMAVGSLMQKCDKNDEHLESNLCTMLQSVRGTNQFWFRIHSQVKCMIREWGPPTIFLTLSCAEYESPDIIAYLRSVNNVSTSYNAGKLCVEDPVSVSRQFTYKFKAFFNSFIKSGVVLGPLDHYYWKKEYQARGAPHYHILLWINQAPVIGVDPPEKIVDFIDKRITCYVPDSKKSPELYRLVTRYQIHRCNAYCKRRRKFGGRFITQCRFNFPRLASESTTLNNVEESLKSRRRIYLLCRNEMEVRINDYNPVLLKHWQANMDIQYVAESSLALANYLSGYVTKAERSNLQEIWESIGECKSVYSKLCSFGGKVMRSRECGLYEATDLILGHHLYEKSDNVFWLNVSMPHKRTRRLKKHAKLKELEENDPESDDIFENNLIDTHYPQRPKRLENVCLYDFVRKYDWYKKDSKGRKTWPTITNPRLINHKIYDPRNEHEREDYYYSLVLLFTPFRDEASLLLENEKAEEAFDRLFPSSDDGESTCQKHHKKLQEMLNAQQH